MESESKSAGGFSLNDLIRRAETLIEALSEIIDKVNELVDAHNNNISEQ